MLNPEFNYIWLDFETTWLEIAKDVPIQIGIVQIDCKWNIIEEFQSLIKPSKKTDNLKDIVWFITWLNIDSLQSAPDIEEVNQKIKHFFNKKTIIIWHNIDFDIDFLKKFFPEIEFYDRIDTFSWAQKLIHYAPSYALEVLVEFLKSDSFFKKYTNNSDRQNERDFHNALEDSKHGLNLFKLLFQYLEDISKKYPELNKIFKYHQLLKKLFESFKIPKDIKKIEIPKLKKILPSHTKISANKEEKIDLDKIKSMERFFIWNYNIKEFLLDIGTNNQIILSFSNIQKLNCAKMILNEIWIKNLWFLKDDQTISYEKFEWLINKSVISEEEVSFVIKYYSHLMQWYGTLDLNNLNDHKIYYSIKSDKQQTKYPIILTTHGWLYSFLERWDAVFNEYKICFFDLESRYKTYNFYLSNPIDLYYTLNFIEILAYKYKLEQEMKPESDFSKQINTINEFYNFFQIFIWQIFIETKELFKNNETTFIQHNPIVDSWDFFRTNKLLPDLRENLNKLEELLSKSDFEIIQSQINKISDTLNKIVNITKKMYNQSDFYFLYSDSTKFTNRSEFIEMFSANKVYFFSNTNKALQNINTDKKNSNSFDINPIDQLEELINYLIYEYKQCDTIFVVSTRKEESKKIFEDLYQNNIHKDVLLLVENITWWYGKNIFKAQSKWKKIIIGWYQFLLNVFWSWIKIDKLIVYNIKWSSEAYILDDIKRYATT